MDIAKKLTQFINSDNILADLPDDFNTQQLVNDCLDGLDIDIKSRQAWADTNDQILKLCDLRLKKKTKAFRGQANVMYPLIVNAVIDWTSRTYPEIVQEDKVCSMAVNGKDPTGSKFLKSQRTDGYLNYCLLKKSEDWALSVDKMLSGTSLCGTTWKKIYNDPLRGNIRSDYCDYNELIVNHNITSLADARRVTHIYPLHMNEVAEYIRLEYFSNIDMTLLDNEQMTTSEYFKLPPQMVNEFGKAYTLFIEQHCWADLDEDGYQEPYIITIHENTRKVVRIVARYDESSVMIKNNKVLKIKAENYFQDYHYIPSPDGAYHSLGLGSLLLSINTMTNHSFNVLLDAGFLANEQGGIIAGKGYKRDKGNLTVSPGEWQVMSGVDDVKFIPFNYKEPSPTLFNLMEFLVKVSKETSSTPDIAKGNQLAQNAPATSVMALIEQSQVIPSAVLKRIYRGLKGEFYRWFTLISKNMDQFLPEYEAFLDEQDPRIIAELRSDFDPSTLDVCPVLDPKLSSSARRLSQAQALTQLAQSGLLQGTNLQALNLRILQALEVDNPEELIQQQEQGPSPEEQQMAVEQQKEQEKAAVAQQELQLKVANFQLEQQRQATKDAETQSNILEAQSRMDKNSSDAGSLRIQAIAALEKARASTTKASSDAKRTN